jgi:hypothetical protein
MQPTGISRSIIVALGAWLAVGGCSAPLISCPLVADSHSHHDCCPRNQPSSALTACPYFVAVKVAPADAIAPANTENAPVLAVIPEFTPVFRSTLQNQHNLYLSIGILRI